MVHRTGPAGPRPLTAAEARQDSILQESLAALGLAAVQPIGPQSERDLDHSTEAEPASVEVQLLIGNDASALSDAYALEAAIREKLDTDRIGHVDGNEIGEGEFTIFVYGPHLEPLLSLIESIVRDYWTRPGARLSIAQAGGDDVEVVLF